MDEYISREAFKARIREQQKKCVSPDDIAAFTVFSFLLQVVDEEPSADVQPVKHSRWISTNDDTFNAYCENCGQERGSKAWNKNDFKYCFGCGAKMEGDDDNDEE